IRRRLRCMKKKRISVKDNLRIPNRFFQKKGLVSLYSFVSKNEYQRVSPCYSGAMLNGHNDKLP
ncbi:MAG: hypothetical protein SVZ03_02780, partial [Spirochaetota bacterium]|nr:hypothetical protein [Spirochaetota bacterium]